MANRTYLYGTDTDSVEAGDVAATELAEAKYCIPLLWLALFRAGDVRMVGNVPMLLAPRNSVLANWQARKDGMRRYLGQPSAHILGAWEAFLHAQNAPFFLLNTQELAMMEDEAGQFAAELAGYFRDLDRISAEDRAERMLDIAGQASRALCAYPYIGPAWPLCGASASRTSPWPEATDKAEPMALLASDFLIEEVVRTGRPLLAEIGALLEGASAKALRPFACVSANWCTPCLEMFDVFADPQMDATLRGIHLLKLDYETWSEEFATIGLDNVSSVPLLLELGADGRMTGRSITGDAWDESTPEQLTRALGPFFRGN